MPSNKPWLDGPTPQEQAKERAWQGAMAFLAGGIFTAVSYFGFGLAGHHRRGGPLLAARRTGDDVYRI